MKKNDKQFLKFTSLGLGALFLLAVAIALFDAYFSDDHAFLPIPAGLGPVGIILLIVMALTFLHGALSVGHKLVSPKVNAQEKKAVFGRLLIVLGIIAAVYIMAYVL
jgi:hypothetical protein